MLAERGRELAACACEPLAHGIAANAEDLGDLRGGEPLDTDQQRDLAIGRRQLGKRALERGLRLRRGDGVEWRAIAGGLVVEVAGELGADGLCARPADDQAVRDREQPRAEPGVLGEPLGMLREPHECLLQQIFCHIAAPRHPHEKAEHALAVRGEYRIERCGLAAPQAVDPRAFVHLHATHHLRARDASFLDCHARRAAALYAQMLDFIRAGGYVMFVLLAIGIPLIVTAALFAWRANPQRLSLVRALTTALVFAAITGIASDLIAVASHVAKNPEWLKEPLPVLLGGFAEALTPAVLAGGLASVAWILVAFGVRRMPKDPS